ncbi:murein hydrolase activator EnvC family protein [Sphingomonas xinjiangensis]|uniref:Septal ring factor EnvC (AmiA/AmiB activator) n=1 Tax=Sphingomonas xinjiangensis TaxID=643568 RepID=A0A840YCY9_9SPHN|nr:peptidoglycan DD-metalloendopeptidase family protein [Sphingomonas xinjiangensis]MBB5711257.1 septal ring factor EnvC (AmiA/AmiB activator) [Sphingomonas xinjiangensis]
MILVPVALAAILATGSLAGAQAPSLGDQQVRLRSASAEASAARGRAQALERAAAAEGDRAAQARAEEAAANERIRAAEADIAAADARIAIVDRLLAAQRAGLRAQQSPILKLLAALQSMARRPPILALIQPGSTTDMVHVRAALGAALPLVEARTAGVRAELQRVSQLRATAGSAATRLQQSRARLEDERLALVQLGAEHRLRSQALGRTALVESDRAIAMGERAREIADQMDSAGSAAEVRASLAGLEGPLPRPSARDTLAARAPGGRPYLLPVWGRLATGFGELSATGVRARGLTLACAAHAGVRAPAAGRVAYAGPFRGYGGVIILDHGNGWTSLLAGLGAVAVRVGQHVAQGAPVGRAGGGEEPRVTVELRRRGTPVDLVQLLD